jgi:RNase P subunit RPR2
MPTLSSVVLKAKGEIGKANLQLTGENTLTIDSIQKYLKKKEQPELLCTYEYDNKVLFLFGYKKGKKGTENKVELPEPYTELACFGDTLVIAALTHHWQNPIPFTIDQWTTFYTEGAMEEEEEEEEEEDDDEKIHLDAFDEEDAPLDEEEEDEDEDAPVLKKHVELYPKVDVPIAKDEISIHSEPSSHPLRMKCLEFLVFLEEHFSKEDILSLEKGIFESSLQQAKRQYIACNWKLAPFREVYQQLVQFIICNLHPESPVNNIRLLSRIKEGEISLDQLPFMTSYEVFPEKWFALKDKLVQREQKILEGNKSRATDQFKCRRCHKSECTYYELQTRSSDEPMTIFITCLNCGKEWRQGG